MLNFRRRLISFSKGTLYKVFKRSEWHPFIILYIVYIVNTRIHILFIFFLFTVKVRESNTINDLTYLCSNLSDVQDTGLHLKYGTSLGSCSYGTHRLSLNALKLDASWLRYTRGTFSPFSLE